jgi:hypothetical protein
MDADEELDKFDGPAQHSGETSSPQLTLKMTINHAPWSLDAFLDPRHVMRGGRWSRTCLKAREWSGHPDRGKGGTHSARGIVGCK